MHGLLAEVVESFAFCKHGYVSNLWEYGEEWLCTMTNRGFWTPRPTFANCRYVCSWTVTSISCCVCYFNIWSNTCVLFNYSFNSWRIWNIIPTENWTHLTNRNNETFTILIVMYHNTDSLLYCVALHVCYLLSVIYRHIDQSNYYNQNGEQFKSYTLTVITLVYQFIGIWEYTSKV